MKVFIRSATSISPQNTFDNLFFLEESVEYDGNRLTCVEPDYHDIIDPKPLRRMSRIIRMSVASALACLKDAAIDKPDAIVTGTAYGCLEDTGTFLSNMVEYDEEPLSPVAFVQSTHNTIGAQIALLLKCNCYNNTFVSGGVSFESALLDAVMLLNEGNTNVLVGGMDEITNMSYAILSRTGLYKRGTVSNLNLFQLKSKGTLAGEGATFFVLSTTPAENSLACIDAVSTFYKPADVTETAQHISTFLAGQSISCKDIDLIITGCNGDERNDEVYSQLQQSVFDEIPSANYKNLCGEYPTSTAFALWVAAKVVKTNSIPPVLSNTGNLKAKINKVLIYNHSQNIHHSLILVSAC